MSKEKRDDWAIDYVIVWSDGHPLYIKATSIRGKELFDLWGVSSEAAGILPPDDAMDFINSFPNHWLVGMEMEEDKQKEFLVQEIPLPQARLVLH